MGLSLRIENETRLPDGGPVTYRLEGKRGADIGRHPHLDWTLPDPTRFISGKHCEVRYRDGGYWLYDVSTNGTYLNDSAGRMQSPHLLRDGDRLTIGQYIIVVEMDGAGSQVDDAQSDIPVAARNAPTPKGENIWEEAEDAAPPLDRKAFKPEPEGGPVRPDYLEWAVDVPDVASSGFALRRAIPKPQQPAQESNEDFDWAGGPAAERPPAAEEPAPVPNPRRPIWAPAEAGSPDAAGKATRETGEPLKRSAEVGPRETPLASAGFEASLSAADVIGNFAKGAGLQANAIAQMAPEEFAERLGQLMLLVVDNLKQLLSARLQAQRLGHVTNQTMIQALDNNPLKFSPSSADALRIMFGPPTESYLEAGRALQESFEDLKTHQIKIFSAMQYALKALMEDLAPDVIEKTLETGSGIGGLLGSRKARLWDVYTARWQAKVHRQKDGMLDAFMLYFAQYYDLAGQDKKS